MNDTDAVTKTLPSGRFDELMIEIQRLLREIHSFELDPRYENKMPFLHLEAGIYSARKFVLAASETVSSQSTLVGGSEFGSPMSEGEKEQIGSWIPASHGSLIDVHNVPTMLSPGDDILGTSAVNENNAPTLSDKVDPDIQNMLIEQFKESAETAIDNGEYGKALEFLAKIIEKSEIVYGEQFEGKSEVLEMFATVYRKQKKWRKAEKMLLNVLKRIPSGASSDSQRSRILHALAEVNFSNENYERAEKWCAQAMAGIKATVGMTNMSFYNSVCLMCRIQEAKGDFMEAEAYRVKLLPPDYKCAIFFEEWILICSTVAI